MNELGITGTLEHERDRAQIDKTNAEAAKIRAEATRANALAFGAVCAVLYGGLEIYFKYMRK